MVFLGPLVECLRPLAGQPGSRIRARPTLDAVEPGTPVTAHRSRAIRRAFHGPPLVHFTLTGYSGRTPFLGGVGRLSKLRFAPCVKIIRAVDADRNFVGVRWVSEAHYLDLAI